MDAASKPVMTTEFASGLRDFLLAGVEGEFPTTRKVVAAIPAGDYRPDPKAKTATELAKHIVEVEVQFLHEIANLEFKMEPYFKDVPEDIAGLLKWYDEQFPKGVERVRAMTGEQLVTPVDFYGMMKMPAVNYLTFVEKHSIHHRGQLATYLRPMGSKIPSIYGGSADEPFNP